MQALTSGHNRVPKPSDKHVFDNLLKTLGPQKMLDMSQRVKAENQALKQASKVRLPVGILMEDALRMYPVSIIREIANEWHLDRNGPKEQIIRDITGAMTTLIPEILDRASDSELCALLYIAKRKGLRVARARRELNASLIDPEFTDPDDPHMFDAFMGVYVKMGILIVGTRNIKGTDRIIVTMASDVRRIAATHTGWDIDFDHVDSSSAYDAKAQREPAGKAPDFKMMPVSPDSPLHGKAASIFKPGMVEIKSGQVLKDPFEAITAFAITAYRSEFEAERKNCPYSTAGMENETHVFKHQMTWFMAEWINPATGTTITEEFVKKFIPDRETAREILQITELFFDVFEVKKHRDGDLIAYGTNTRKMYRLVTMIPDFYPAGTTFEGLAHPYGDKYKLSGITTKRV